MKIFAVIAILFLPLVVSASVVINEVAWMGTANSANDEWIELYNNGVLNVDITGWKLMAQDGTPDITLNGNILAGSFFLLERTDDTSVPLVAADQIYTGALGNEGEILIFKNAAEVEVDRVDASGGWPAGDNTTKETMQKSGGWITAAATPRAQNVGQSFGQNQTNTAPAAGTSSYAPTPTVLVNAGPDRTIYINEEVVLNGTVTIIQGKESEIRFLWDFGNGSMQEGQEVRYTYTYPGTYTVAFTATLGTYAHTDYVKVTVKSREQIVSAPVEKEITKDESAVKLNMPQPQVAQVVQPVVQKNEGVVSDDENPEARNTEQVENDENKITVKDSTISLRDIFAFSRWLALAGLVGLAAAAALVFLR